MHFDYVDIGTSDFDTAISWMKKGEKVLLVEPILRYLSNLPEGEGIYKANFAISNRSAYRPIFYLSEKAIQQMGLPGFLKGCNSLDFPHKTVIDAITMTGNSLSAISQSIVRLITFKQLIELYDITSIGKLKIDTEGHDHIILKDVLKEVENGMKIGSITVEYMQQFGNIIALDELFKTSGYHRATLANDNVTLSEYEKKNNRSRRPSPRKTRGSKTLPRARKRTRK